MYSFLQLFAFSVLPLFFTFFVLRWVSSTRTRTRARPQNLPPSPPGLPMIGNFHQLGPLAHRDLHSLAQKYGPIMLLRFGRVPTVVVSSADAASEIMKTHDLIFADRPRSRLTKKLLYDWKDVSVAPYGESWRQLKSIYVVQLLSNRRVKSFHGVRLEETALVVEKIKKLSSLAQPVDLTEVFTSLTNDVISRAAFGRKYGEGESGKKFKQLLRDFLWLLGLFDVGDYVPWLGWVSRVSGLDAEVERVARELDEFLEDVIEERRNSLGTESACQGKDDFLDILLRIYKDDGGGSIDRDSLKTLVLTAFAAGTDTTSTFLEWAMTELLRHPGVMKKVQIEVREILQGKQEITEDDLKKMNYLNATIKESFRLHPPIPMLVPREARQDVQVMGYDIAAGTTVIINAWAIGRDPSLWDGPDEFRPERFLDSPIDFNGLDFQLIPFGSGRRGCPGISFAMAVNELMLANLVHVFDWTLPDGAKAEELDMTEYPGVAVHRKFPLLAVATPWSP